jgi:hypothetical protein
MQVIITILGADGTITHIPGLPHKLQQASSQGATCSRQRVHMLHRFDASRLGLRRMHTLDLWKKMKSRQGE